MKKLIVVAIIMLLGSTVVLVDKAFPAAADTADVSREEFVQKGAKILAVKHAQQDLLDVMDMYIEKAKKNLAENFKDLAKNDPLRLNLEMVIFETEMKVASCRLQILLVFAAENSWQLELMDMDLNAKERTDVLAKTKTAATVIYNGWIGKMVKHQPDFMTELKEAKKAAAKRKQS